MNPESESAEFALIKQLMTNIKCVVCQKRYGVDDVRFVDHRNGVWILEVMCGNCGTRGLVFAVLKEGELKPAIGELSPEERTRFQKMPEIDTNEILELRRFLKDFKGDFTELFRQRQV